MIPALVTVSSSNREPDSSPQPKKGTFTMADEKKEVAGGPFELEAVTSAVSVLADDGIVVHVVNDSGATENARVVIYQNTGAGAVTVADSGRVAITPTWTWGLAFPVKDSGEYWLRVQTTSEALIPRASFERAAGATWNPVVRYEPGDFATFSLTRKRLW
jgi:hypothetical protein